MENTIVPQATEIKATPAQIAATFTEWERRYREEPEAFASDYQRFMGSEEAYGDGAAAYFLEIMAGIQAA